MSTDDILKKIQDQLSEINHSGIADSNQNVQSIDVIDNMKRNLSRKDTTFIDVLFYFKKKIADNIQYILPIVSIYTLLFLIKPFFVMDTTNFVKDSKVYKRRRINHKKIIGLTFVIYIIAVVGLIVRRANSSNRVSAFGPY